eukprot:GFKZ01015761.1.p1 GENE.GFKZ01015761.1~~GFKZ01015761.1.p1  ORF type:complete len:312 (+),score=30.19 GFKZ01015761.1:130-936(+)
MQPLPPTFVTPFNPVRTFPSPCTPCVTGAHRPSRMQLDPRNQPPTDPNDDNRFARLPEFTSAGGNALVQDVLVREALRRATYRAATESFESTIQDKLDAVSGLLSDMYMRSERDIRNRNDELVRKESLSNVSKWNQQLIEGSKQSKISRSEISKELAIVDALLRRNHREKQRRRSRRRRSVVVRRISSGPTNDGAGDGSQRSVMTHPARIALGAFTCVSVIQTFEGIASQEDGPANLVKCAAVSSLLILLVFQFKSRSSAEPSNPRSQ